ncbi:hypothetical protein KJS94_03930 [Flavihumibacter rivuli]|uniref:hypothetical protein n=1 Tax=Flavihumibacter rivuli TaxID=2838156 RepID=UPI001BDF595B|nr:hypothetical protein [Flavihumibacter rivuli]ULQ57349.1 hypothetical protein KJS94_03930 [Flavihumibacter rivuli]
MAKKWVLLFLFVGVCLLVQAQPRPVFQSRNLVGILAAEKENAFEMHTVNGIRWNNWAVGIGLGFDGYRFQSIPAYLSLARYFQLKKNWVYIIADGGLNFPLEKSSAPSMDNWFDSNEFKPGSYFRGGLGYAFQLSKPGKAILMELGYSYKRIREEQVKVLPCINPPCPQTTDKLNYDFNRWSIRLGYQL